MPSLSFDESSGGKEGTPIAMVKGGKYDKDILYMHDDSLTGRRPKVQLDKTKYVKDLKGFTPSQKTRAFVKIDEALHKGDEEMLKDEPQIVKDIYKKALEDNAERKDIVLDDDGIFEVLPPIDAKNRSVFYIAGQSGSGKSYFAKGIAEYYHKLFPTRGIYLISKLNDDETLDALKFLKRINIQSFVDDYPDLSEFRDSLCIFDDYDVLTGDAGAVVQKIINDLCTLGRHERTSLCLCTHYLTNYSKTRLILNESQYVVVYPLSTSYYQLKYLLQNYVGVEQDDLKRYKKLGSRWLCFRRGFPSYMISQRSAELLHNA